MRLFGAELHRHAAKPRRYFNRHRHRIRPRNARRSYIALQHAHKAFLCAFDAKIRIKSRVFHLRAGGRLKRRQRTIILNAFVSSFVAHRNPTHASTASHRIVFHRVSRVPPPRQSRAQSRARRREDRSLFVRTPPQPRSLDSRRRTTRWFRTIRSDDARATELSRFARTIPRGVSSRRTSGKRCEEWVSASVHDAD